MSKPLLIKLFADLAVEFGSQIEFPLQEARQVDEILAELHIPIEKIEIFLVNSRHIQKDSKVFPGDVLTLFMPVGGG